MESKTMEAKTASHRSAEARHGRTVRWVISQFEAVREKVEARAGAIADRDQSWPEEAYERGRSVTVRKRISDCVEQSELWPTISKRDEPTEAELLMVGDTPMAEDLCIEKEVVEMVEVPEKRERRKIYPALKYSGPREKSRAVRENTIARFLNLSGAIDVPKSNEVYIDFPDKGLFQSLQLWTHSPEPQDFSPNQF